MTSPLPPFHLALPVADLASSETFYHGLLGCPIGRRSDSWIDFNFFGHQLVTHLAPDALSADITNEVDEAQVPVRHFGAVLDRQSWEAVAARISGSDTAFLIAPTIRFAGKPGEQGTFFCCDPSGNALEFKYFLQPDELFKT